MEQITLKALLKKNICGKIICFPTDTVYGVGAIYDDEAAINKIYYMKQRSKNKPLAILTPTKNIEKYVQSISEDAQKLIDLYWPGALTLIFKKSDLINDKITMGLPTIAMRMPNSIVALQILNHFGLMATTSVNISGEKELNSVNEISQEFSDFIDYIVIDKDEVSNKPSKIIDVSGEMKVIRN